MHALILFTRPSRETAMAKQVDSNDSAFSAGLERDLRTRLRSQIVECLRCLTVRYQPGQTVQLLYRFDAQFFAVAEIGGSMDGFGELRGMFAEFVRMPSEVAFEVLYAETSEGGVASRELLDAVREETPGLPPPPKPTLHVVDEGDTVGDTTVLDSKPCPKCGGTHYRLSGATAHLAAVAQTTTLECQNCGQASTTVEDGGQPMDVARERQFQELLGAGYLEHATHVELTTAEQLTGIPRFTKTIEAKRVPDTDWFVLPEMRLPLGGKQSTVALFRQAILEYVPEDQLSEDLRKAKSVAQRVGTPELFHGVTPAPRCRNPLCPDPQTCTLGGNLSLHVLRYQCPKCRHVVVVEAKFRHGAERDVIQRPDAETIAAIDATP